MITSLKQVAHPFLSSSFIPDFYVLFICLFICISPYFSVSRARAILLLYLFVSSGKVMISDKMNNF